jgi:hypothetical protein
MGVWWWVWDGCGVVERPMAVSLSARGWGSPGWQGWQGRPGLAGLAGWSAVEGCWASGL